MRPDAVRSRPPSPAALALAQVWSVAVDAGLLVLAVGLMVEAWAPPQDLPWKPLRLADPPGLATGVKLARVGADPVACRRILSDGGVVFDESPSREQGFCSTRGTIRIQGGTTPLSPAAPIMTCRQALRFALWDRHVLGPAAKAALNEPLARVEHYGTYACRNIYGRPDGRPSQHARANALDVAGFRTASGRRISVANDFRRSDDRGAFLRQAARGACPWFAVVLGPNYNAAHADHLHLDSSSYRLCRP